MKRRKPNRAFGLIKSLLSKAPLLKRLLYGLTGYILYHRSFRRSLFDRNIFLIGTPEHGNLGDHAIAYATKEYLSKILPDFRLTEISEEMYFKYAYCLKQYSKRSDLFLLSGGGNIGNQYRTPELIRRCVIQSFPKNGILIFPQTVYFTEDKQGNRERKKSFQLYGRHKHLTIIAREQYSYEYFKRYLPEEMLFLTPDIVLTLVETKPEEVRSGAVICFRKDGERRLRAEETDLMKQSLIKHYDDICELDTDLGIKVDIRERVSVLEEFWSGFQKAGLVVTDRLHGMIFAAITGTPCIAFSNYNYKLKGSYQWLKHLPYIRYLEETDQFDDALQQLSRLPMNGSYSNELILPHFEKLRESLMCAVQNTPAYYHAEGIYNDNKNIMT